MNKLEILKERINIEIKKDWRKFVSTAEICDFLTESIEYREFQLSDFNFFINKSSIEVLYKNNKFLKLSWNQNPVSKIIRINKIRATKGSFLFPQYLIYLYIINYL